MEEIFKSYLNFYTVCCAKYQYILLKIVGLILYVERNDFLYFLMWKESSFMVTAETKNDL